MGATIIQFPPPGDPECDHCGGDPDTACPICHPRRYAALMAKQPPETPLKPASDDDEFPF
jgi:hypothetical protein